LCEQHAFVEGRRVISAIAAVTVLAIAVVWGATARPGRPFSWTMFSGSSKAFLWLGVGPARRLASMDDLHLTPDSHYLLEGDLQRLAAAGALPALDGLIVGSRGSWKVACDGDGRLHTEPIDPDDDLAQLAAALRRACPQR
jgi:hypothetical protein